MSEAQYLNKLVRICKKYAFPWPDIITQATNKDNWVNEVDTLAAIKTFNQEHLLVWYGHNQLILLLSIMK